MRILLFICALLIITGCITNPTNRENMQSCKSLCRQGVERYQDDNIECQCKTSKIDKKD